ncbi:MAG: Ppx/GppA family phosphatase [Pontixanthobacter sp.]
MARKTAYADHEGMFSGSRVERAIIDIGSNTVRLVVYGGAPRAPNVLFNEKVAARLGRDIAETGQLADEAVELALRGLRRFALLLREWRIAKVDVVATAAVREASNGADFLSEVRDLGFEPRLLAGADEARISAMGVIGAFPGNRGIVADLGGGSLELIAFADNVPGNGTSLPLGTLRLPEHRGQAGGGEMAATLAAMLNNISLGHREGDTLYLVGGTWRAMAVVAMSARDYPLSDPHGFHMAADKARRLVGRLADLSPEELQGNPRITSMRASYLPDAGILLGALLDRLRPDRVVFSSWGLREGVLFDELEDFTKAQDPLLAGVGEFANSRGTPPVLATRIAAWTVGASKHANGTPTYGSERLRLSATMLALASMQIEPNLRTALAMDWALHKRWVDVDAAGRAMMAATVAANKNDCDLPPELTELASADELEEAIGWGLAIRLCRRLGGRSNALLNVSRLTIEEETLVLQLEPPFADLFGLPNEKDLRLLAERLGLSPEFRIVEPAEPA